MNFGQMAKRTLLFILVNILVVTTISIVLSVLGAYFHIPRTGLTGLAVMCLVWGFGGAFISLAISRLMAKWFMGVQVIPPNTNDPEGRALVQLVHGLAQKARLPKMPEVGIYESADINAFATGPTKSRALVAVSTGLLRNMSREEIEGVLGHEVAHIANGDMVTMTLVQGVINAIVMFLARILAFAIGQALRSRDDRDRGGGWLDFILVQVFQIVFSILGSIVVCWFSRHREYRADAGGAHLAGKANMIDALQALRRLHDPEIAAADAAHAQSIRSLKISGSGGFMALFSTHPPLEERIARLEQEAR